MIGKTISHFKIIEKLGEGGMGIVYKAEDSKLKRHVALKFLPSELTRDAEAKKRFIHEARAASALQHTNICTIHAIDETEDGQLFICMDYYKGETLKKKIDQRPLKLDDAINITVQIAQGLAKAHEAGIVHRDIKPANIIVTEDDEVKILDFGLVKLTGFTKLTKPGSTLGTTWYMSPEQLRGEKVDHRTDIWALGVVLYEMIAGQQPFKGEYEQAVSYAIMNDEPESITALRSGIPIALDGVISKALAKEPNRRYQHIDEVPVDLENIDSRPSGISRVSTAVRGVQKKNRRGYTVPIISLITLIALTVAFISVWLLYRPNPQPIKRWNISLPESAPLVPVGSSPFALGQPALAISPDGTKLVYVADIGNQTQLYIRPMDEFKASPIPGTEGAYHPFFSPDCQWIGFFANKKLKKMSVFGGSPITLCDVTHPSGASWGYDGQIVFADHEGNTLTLISEDGGETHQLAMKTWTDWPKILPGGMAFLSSIGFRGIKVVFLKSGEEKTILEGPYSNPIYLPTGHLLYERVGRLEVVPFDLDDLKVTGSSVSILDNVRIERRSGGVQCTISSDGTLIYVPGELQTTGELVWVSRRGTEEALPFPAADYGSFQISPDGRQLAIEIRDAEQFNIWIYDLLGGVSTKLTLEGNNFIPIWTNDGKWITFTSDRTGTYNLFMKKVDGTGVIKQLTAIKEKFHVASSWSPDDKVLAFEEISTRGSDIYLLDMDEQGDKYQFSAEPRFTEWGPAFSPDGKWIAYTSDEQGQYDIYVEPYPQTGKRIRISTDTGEEPVWSRCSKELFYRNVEKGKRFMVVKYSITGSEFVPGIPQILFEGDYINVDWRSHDVSPDGQRFLLVKMVDETHRYTQLNVITNWFEELKRKMSQGN